ncbi:MAG: COG4648 family protein [Thiobacillus sp.]
MSHSLARTIRWIVIAAGAITYPVLAHYSTTPAAVASMPWLGVATSLTPALAILLFMTWNSPRKPAMLLLCAVVGMLLWGFWGMLERNFSWAYFIQHAGTNLMLATVFGVTLARGRQALCSRFAEAVHGSLEPDVLRYTRQLTLAWTLFFITISLISTLLFAFAPIETWSIFANFLTFPLVLLMFAVEFLVRLRKLPNLERHSILDGMLAFWKTPPKRPNTPPPIP